MRHRNQGTILDRTQAPRRALLRGLARELIDRGRIVTTLAKARAVRPLVERAIASSASADLATRRRLLKTFPPKTVNHLLTTLGPKYRERHGGYTRIVKLVRRQGDGAHQAVIELLP